jgi:hypothetical protein
MPESQPDGPLPDDTDAPTDEATIDHAAILQYSALIPQRPIMAHGLED